MPEKIAFINGSISLSETFIYELVKGVTQRYPQTIFFTNSPPHYTQGINYTCYNYIKPVSKLQKHLKRLSPGWGNNLLWKQQQKHAYKILKKELSDYEVIYIDYGTSAVRIVPILETVEAKVFVHFHGFDITSALKDPFYKKELQKIFTRANKLIVASNHIRRLLELEGAPHEKIEVIRLGVKSNTEHSSEQLWEKRLSKPTKHLVSIGRLTEKKHPIATIKAFEIVHKRYGNTVLDIIGDGPLLASCKKLVQQLNLEHAVHFHGSLSHNEALKFLENAWCYVQHSVTAATGDQEGFAISLAEASLYYLPVVSTLHNGIPENVLNGETGYLVREFDFENMAEKIVELIENPLTCKKMGEAGHIHIKNLCAPSIRINRIINLFKNS